MKHRRAMIAALVALPLTSVPVAHAEGSIAPPFAEADASAGCQGGVRAILIMVPAGDPCSAEANATESGSLSARVDLRTGNLPVSSSSGFGYAYVSGHDSIDGATFVLYTVTYSVTAAHFSTTADDAYGYVYLDGWISSPDLELYDAFSRRLAADDEPAVADGVYTSRLLLASSDGEPVSGTVNLDLTLSVEAGISETPAATASTGADVEILSVTKRIIE